MIGLDLGSVSEMYIPLRQWLLSSEERIRDYQNEPKRTAGLAVVYIESVNNTRTFFQTYWIATRRG